MAFMDLKKKVRFIGDISTEELTNMFGEAVEAEVAAHRQRGRSLMGYENGELVIVYSNGHKAKAPEGIFALDIPEAGITKAKLRINIPSEQFHIVDIDVVDPEPLEVRFFGSDGAEIVSKARVTTDAVSGVQTVWGGRALGKTGFVKKNKKNIKSAK